MLSREDAVSLKDTTFALLSFVWYYPIELNVHSRKETSMGYVRHDAVIVTVGDYEELHQKVAEFRDSLPEEFQRLVVGPVESVSNFYYSYVFLPDGSKEGWKPSDDGDLYREKFVRIFNSFERSNDIVKVTYGGDSDAVSVEMPDRRNRE